MEKNKKVPFFIKAKRAICNFDKYQLFAEEKTRDAIKYFLKMLLLVTVIITIMVLVYFIQVIGKVKNIVSNELPDFKFEDSSLVIEGENKQFIKSDAMGYVSFIIDSEKENLSEIENTGSQTVIAFLKNKVAIKNFEGTETSVSYLELNNKIQILDLTKDGIIQLLNNKWLYVIVFIVSYIYFYFTYGISILYDIFLISIIGWLVSRLINVRFKYKVIFNLSVYSLTLSIILYALYLIVNVITGFTIKYFDIAYNGVAYIYLITAMLMIKSDLLKQQIELAKIMNEQKKVNQETSNQDKEDGEKETDNKDDTNSEKKENELHDKLPKDNDTTTAEN